MLASLFDSGSSCAISSRFAGMFEVTGSPLDQGLTYAAFGLVALLAVSFGFNVVANLVRRRKLVPTRVHRSTRVTLWLARATLAAKALTVLAVAIESVVQAAQYTMVLEQFFELPATPGALFWQNRLFLILCGVMFIIGIVQQRAARKLRAKSAPEAISAALNPGRSASATVTRPRYDAPRD